MFQQRKCDNFMHLLGFLFIFFYPYDFGYSIVFVLEMLICYLIKESRIDLFEKIGKYRLRLFSLSIDSFSLKDSFSFF
jgi:hypothetical protein